ncbi:hypothetical protein V6N11_021576 [Hibiscus sabdariffa]|uniref:Uncharacterized protein n=2 Tax=Hibiscus sabdariffa TaxID=183260 RepID=A0ABR2A091_9ROSI
MTTNKGPLNKVSIELMLRNNEVLTLKSVTTIRVKKVTLLEFSPIIHSYEFSSNETTKEASTKFVNSHDVVNIVVDIHIEEATSKIVKDYLFD